MWLVGGLLLSSGVLEPLTGESSVVLIVYLYNYYEQDGSSHYNQ